MKDQKIIARWILENADYDHATAVAAEALARLVLNLDNEHKKELKRNGIIDGTECGKKAKSFGEILDEVSVESKKPVSQRLIEQGNCWRMDDNGNLFLPREVESEGDTYWLSKDLIREDQVLDWMTHMSEKRWVTPAILGDLYRAFVLILGYLK